MKEYRTQSDSLSIAKTPWPREHRTQPHPCLFPFAATKYVQSSRGAAEWHRFPAPAVPRVTYYEEVTCPYICLAHDLDMRTESVGYNTVWDHYGSQPTLMLNSDALPLGCPSGKPVLSSHVHQSEGIA